MIYLDYAATTPMSQNSLDVYTRVAKQYYGNPSSLHDIGTTTHHILERCREEIASSINGETRGVFFTGGGSDSNILAIRSLAYGNLDKGNHLITTKLEHSSLLNLFHSLEDEGFKVTYLPVDKNGQIRLNELKEAITDNTILASIHHANSEIGTLQNIKEVGVILNKHNILFHSDCVQTYGKVPIHVDDLHIDSLSISSHKIYGPKGVGACYIRPSVKWKSVVPGTSHENGFRPGTVNVPGIAAFTAAAEDMITSLEAEQLRMKDLREQLLNGLVGTDRKFVVEGHPEFHLPHIMGLRIRGIEGQYTMLECNRYGLAISTGSACSVGKQAPSKTMIETGKTNAEAKEFVRLSLGKPTTQADIKEVVRSFENFLNEHFEHHQK